LKVALNTIEPQPTTTTLVAGRWFSPVSSNKTNHHNITDIFLKVVLNTITLTKIYFYVDQKYYYLMISIARCEGKDKLILFDIAFLYSAMLII
jgi:hypothetical protein